MIARHLQLFASLNDHQVEYLVIGGALAITYGVPRITKDLDIFLNPQEVNAERCLEALKASGIGSAALTTAKELCSTEITIFKDIVRLDVLTQVKGIQFAAAWQRRVYLELNALHIPALHIDDLIATKRAAARPGDLEDIKILEMAKREQEQK